VQRGGDDVIVRSRDHGGRAAHQRSHWLHDVNHTLMMHAAAAAADDDDDNVQSLNK